VAGTIRLLGVCDARDSHSGSQRRKQAAWQSREKPNFVIAISGLLRLRLAMTTTVLLPHLVTRSEAIHTKKGGQRITAAPATYY
jgi:hypothetical protein